MTGAGNFLGARILVLGLCLFAAACHRRVVTPVHPPTNRIDQSNTPPWTGGWSIIGRGATTVRFFQTFTPQVSRLTAVEIDVLTGNRGVGGDDVTVMIVEGDRVLVSVTKGVPEGFDGILRFEFPAPRVAVAPGSLLQLRVEDTNRNVFGWRYGPDTYPGGVAHFNGVPWNNGAFDFRFITYGS